MYHAGKGTNTYTRTPPHFCEVFPDFLIVYTPPLSSAPFRDMYYLYMCSTHITHLLNFPHSPILLPVTPLNHTPLPFPPLLKNPLQPPPSRSHPNKRSPQSPNQATTPTPQLLAVATTLLHNPSNPTPFNLSSVCLIRAISKTCFRLTSPTTSPFPGVIPPLIFPFRSFTPAACRSKYEVVGVRRAK